MQLPIQATQGGPDIDLQAFNEELSSWETFWSKPRRLPDESPETALLPLAKTLSKNPALLEVCHHNAQNRVTEYVMQ